MRSSTWNDVPEERRDRYFLAFAQGLLADGELGLGRLRSSKADRQQMLEFARLLAEEALAVVDA